MTGLPFPFVNKGKRVDKVDKRYVQMLHSWWKAEKGGKGLRVIGKGEKIKFYLDRLDRIFEVEPIVIEGLNHAVNFGMEFLLQQEVSISFSEQEAKLVTGSGRQERLS